MADPHDQNTMAQELLRETSNVQTVSDEKQALPLLAAEEGYKEVVKFIPDEGANVNTQGENHVNATQVDLSGSHEQIKMLLLDKNSDVSSRGETFSNCTEEVLHSNPVSRISTYEDSLLLSQKFCSDCVILISKCRKAISQKKQRQCEFITIYTSQRPRRCNGSEPLTRVIFLLFFIFSR